MDYKGTPLENIKIYSMQGIELMHISDFTKLTHRSNQSTRHLIEDGNVVRKLKAFRDRSRLMIPVKEIFGFPLIKPGHSKNERLTFHYMFNENKTDIIAEMCPICSMTTGWCQARQEAEDLVVPEGDK